MAQHMCEAACMPQLMQLPNAAWLIRLRHIARMPHEPTAMRLLFAKGMVDFVGRQASSREGALA
eukprot:363049-Chlamydomonas_euryale.AAC.30